MSIYKEINRRPSRRDLFNFGAIFAAGMGMAGLVNHFYLHKEEVAQTLWIIGAAVFVLALVPGIGRLLYILWMGLGLTIGFFTAPVIMFVVYLLVVVPLALVFKVIKRDTMRRDLDPEARSYWEDHPGSEDPASYVRQF
jgi:Saxitoxin biosynthesis operon protein SxtJ